MIDSSTSQTSGASSELLETLMPVSTVTPVTPTVTGTSIAKVEPPQLPKETRTESNEMVTQVVQQQVDSQPEVVQQEITSKPESIQPEVDHEPISVQSEVTSELEVVQEAQPKPVLLPEQLVLEFEQSEIVTIPEEYQPIHPQISITVETSSLS